jgi:hypothetical protein
MKQDGYASIWTLQTQHLASEKPLHHVTWTRVALLKSDQQGRLSTRRGQQHTSHFRSVHTCGQCGLCVVFSSTIQTVFFTQYIHDLDSFPSLFPVAFSVAIQEEGNTGLDILRDISGLWKGGTVKDKVIPRFHYEQRHEDVRRSGGKAPSFLISVPGECEWSASRPCRFIPKGTRYPLCRMLGGAPGRLDVVAKRKNPSGKECGNPFDANPSPYCLNLVSLLSVITVFLPLL